MTTSLINENPHEATIGLVINPIAGMGGRVGLKGSDGTATVREAQRRGASPQAAQRALLSLAKLAAIMPELRVITAGGAMGEEVARAAGFDPIVVYKPEGADTARADTHAAVEAMTKLGIGLILFAGGDGTARDVLGAKAPHIPMLGVPAGVKMHSAVFGTNPRSTGQLAALYLTRDPAVALRDAEVMDIDEGEIRNDRLSALLYGYALSPYEKRLSQNAKAGARPGEEAMLDGIARKVAARMRPDRLYILGPGTSTRRVSEALGVPSTLLGVDAVMNGRLVGQDLDEEGIMRLMAGRETHIVVGVLGGQGSLFGRGNQQISSEVIQRTGRDHITVIAALEKLIALNGQPLRVDTGNANVDAMLSGHIRVMTGLEQDTIFRVQA